MSLEKWVEYAEPTSPGEIKDLLRIVERSLADSKVEAVSTDLRFIAAFNAALRVADKLVLPGYFCSDIESGGSDGLRTLSTATVEDPR
jgi:hypothetical protein